MNKKQIILLVDDEIINAKVLREILKTDYTILVATSGEDALETIESGESLPDLILLQKLNSSGPCFFITY